MQKHLLAIAFMTVSALVVMAGLFATVHTYGEAASVAHRNHIGLGDRWDRTIQRWIDRGFVHEGGMQFWDRKYAQYYPRSLPPPHKIQPDTAFAWRNSTMSWILPAFLMQSAYAAFTGRYSPRLMTFYNQLVIAAVAAALGYLCFLLALHLGQSYRHALALGAAALLVFQTHPLSLMSYWEVHALSVLLLFALIFLAREFLLQETGRAHDRKGLLVQTAIATLVIFSEPVTGGLFMTSYLVIQTVLSDEPPTSSDWAAKLVIPSILVIFYLLWQQAMVRSNYASVVFVGSEIAFRTGLDGDTTYYRDVFDIWLRPHLPDQWIGKLVDWHYLNAIGLLATAVVVGSYRQVAVLRSPVRLLLATYGLYLPLAILFSQLVYIHPYYWNIGLLVAFVIAIFCLVPAYLNATRDGQGLPILAALLLAFFYAVYHARAYRMIFPYAV